MSNNIRVTYFDTAMVIIEVNGVRLLTDPVLDPAGSAFDYGPLHLEKTSPASVTPEQLGRIDAVLLSHEQHGDNLDRAGRELLSSVPSFLGGTSKRAPRVRQRASRDKRAKARRKKVRHSLPSRFSFGRSNVRGRQVHKGAASLWAPRLTMLFIPDISARPRA